MRYLFILALLCAPPLFAETVEYQLSIDYDTIETEAGTMQGMLVNQQYPAPTLYFNEGDVARITVHNNMDVDTSVHWHGLLVPPEEDGVPYISNFPIPANGSYTYEFPLKHSGTYWYHSHTNLQEQLGLHGGIVIRLKQKRYEVDHEALLVLQDFTTEEPKQVLANLKKSGHYYALKKDSVLHLLGYLKANNIKAWWNSRWTRMGGMDISDVGYDAFFINGKQSQTLFPEAKPGDRVRLRIVNAGTSSYFYWDSHEKLPVKIISADGVDVQPIVLDEILHAPAETYDLLLSIPDSGSFELRATAQDITGFANIFIGGGEKQAIVGREKPNMHAMTMSHNMGEMNMASGGKSDNSMAGHAHHRNMDDMDSMEEDPEGQYQKLRSLEKSELPEGELREIELRLTGRMDGYTWTFDDIPLSAADKIKIKRGERVRMKFINETMMHHPLHLHGHFFRVLVGHGEYEPLKHTVDVKPMETTTIEFYANEKKDWFFHCHNLYHAKTGMARVISYHGDTVNEDLAKAKQKSPDIKDTDFYYRGELKLLNDFGRLELDYFNTLHQFSLEVSDYEYEYRSSELDYLFRTSRWAQLFVGVEHDEEETLGRVGLEYVLPLLIDTRIFVTEEGELEAELETHLQLSKRVEGHLEYATEDSYHAGLEYRFNEAFSLEAAYTNEVDYSIGGKLRF